MKDKLTYKSTTYRSKDRGVNQDDNMIMVKCCLPKNSWKSFIKYLDDWNSDTEHPEEPEQEEKSCDNCFHEDDPYTCRTHCSDHSYWKPNPQDKQKEWKQKSFSSEVFPLPLKKNHLDITKKLAEYLDHNAEGTQLCLDKIDRLTERVKANENDILNREGAEQVLFDKIAELEKQIKEKR